MQENVMSEEKRKPEESDDDQPDVEEVVTDFDEGIRVTSAFNIEQQGEGVLGINVFGPTFEFLDGDEDGLDLDDEDEQE
jgi:hypothetical protein